MGGLPAALLHFDTSALRMNISRVGCSAAHPTTQLHAQQPRQSAMLLHWLDAVLGQGPSKFPLDEYRPEIPHPETAQDWITNIGWLKQWIASVFTNFLKLDPDLTKRSEAASTSGKDFNTWFMRLDFEEARVRWHVFRCYELRFQFVLSGAH